jgi:hypothetical protein
MTTENIKFITDAIRKNYRRLADTLWHKLSDEEQKTPTAIF